MSLSLLRSKRLRLAYVVNSLNPGGTEKLVVEMALALCMTCDIEVFCLDEPGIWARELRSRGIPVHCLWRQPGLDLSMSLRLAEHFRRMRADIVHAHQCTPWFYAALSRMCYMPPRNLLEEHGRFFPEVDSFLRRLTNRLIIAPLTDRFIAVSADIRTRLVKHEGLKASRIEVVYNGVSPEAALSTEQRLQLRSELGFSAEDFVVGTVGRFDSIKNLPMLVASIAGAAEKHGCVRGLLVGAGPEFAPINSLVQTLGLEQRVVLTGFRTDARRLVQCMDLFVLSSLSEGTSMALLEAMAAGIPAAVTAVGGNTEIIRNEENGWLVRSGSVPQLTGVIVEAIENPAGRSAMGEAGRREFQMRFTFDRMITRYRCIYDEMVPPLAAIGQGETNRSS